MNTDRIFGLGIAASALLFILFAVPTISDDWQTSAGAQYFTVGPRLFPYIAASLCGLLGIALAVHPQRGHNLGNLKERAARRNVMIAIGLSILYASVLDVLGFLLATFAALLLFLLVFGERRWYVIAPIVVGVPLVVSYIFLKFFMLELPPGLLELPV